MTIEEAAHSMNIIDFPWTKLDPNSIQHEKQ